jgi:hypothetical protein
MEKMKPNEETRNQDRRDAALQPGAGRMPTREEIDAADAAADAIDEGVKHSVAIHEHEMNEIGAHVRGEGAIE